MRKKTTKRKRAPRQVTKALAELRKRVLNAILANKCLYVKDTGVRVFVTNFNEDLHTKYLEHKFHINVEVSGVATVDCLSKFLHYSIRTDRHNVLGGGSNTPNPPRIEGYILLENLSTEPYESEASKILYSKS